LRFFWSYHPDYWEGLRRCGLLRGEIGVKFVQSPFSAADAKFNRAAAAGTPLHRLIYEHGYGLLVDRGAGGGPYCHYEFDRALLDSYAARLGDSFLGVQLHEWILRICHLAMAVPKQGLQALVNAQGNGDVFDELGVAAAQDYEKRFPLADAEAFMAEATDYYRRLAQRFGGHVNLVDGGGNGQLQGLRLGARHVMPELGNQTPMSRLQVAYVRGMARSTGRPWGAYYECWGGEPFSVTCYNGQSLWLCPEEHPGNGEGFKHGGARWRTALEFPDLTERSQRFQRPLETHTPRWRKADGLLPYRRRNARLK
jgi:hypothetical protein